MDFTSFLSQYQKVPVLYYHSNVAKSPMVSVCVQTYQHSKFIHECLDGILKQKTTFPIEILLGEDESTDGTREICIDYANKYPDKIRLFLHSRKNNIRIGGTPTGRFNFLFNLFSAHGKYIAICEGDDYWTDPYKLQKQVDFLEANMNIVGCFHNVVTVDKSSKLIKDNYHDSKRTTYNQLDSLAHGGSYATCSLVFKSITLKNIPLWFIKACSDYAIDLLITEFGDIGYLNENMGAYRIHEGGIWQGNKEHLNMESVILRYKACLQNPNFRKKYGRFFYNKISEVSLTLIRHYQDRKIFFKSIIYAMNYFYYAHPKNTKFFKMFMGKIVIPLINLEAESVFKKMGFLTSKIKQLIGRSITAIKLDNHKVVERLEIKLEGSAEKKRTYYYREGARFKCLKKYDFKTIVDIGANEGQFAGKIMTVFPEAKVHCFEPLKEAFEQLKSEFKEQKNVTFYNFGLGAENKSLEIFKNEYSPSSSFLEMLDIHKTNFDFAIKVEQEAVKIKRLDEVFRTKIEKPLLVKIDVQGYEKFVLDGGINVISKTDVVIIETSFASLYKDQSLFDDIYNYLRDLGFHYSGSLEQLMAPDTGEILQQDALFIREK